MQKDTFEAHGETLEEIVHGVAKAVEDRDRPYYIFDTSGRTVETERYMWLNLLQVKQLHEKLGVLLARETTPPAP